MASFKTYFNINDTKKSGKINLYIRLLNNRTSVLIPLNIAVTEKDLDKDRKSVKNNSINKILFDKINEYENIYNLHFSEQSKSMTAKELWAAMQNLKNREEPIDFYSFAEEYIQKLREDDRKGSAGLYAGVVNSLKDYRPQLTFQELKSSFLTSFEAYLRTPRTIIRNNGRCDVVYQHPPMQDAGIAGVMKRIRALFNAAKLKYNDDNEDVVRIKHEPFQRYKIPEAKETRKRNISEKEIAKIINYTPEKGDTELMQLARDIFVMTLMLGGINSADLYHALPPQKGRLVYCRQKTRDRRKDGAQMSIKIPQELKPVLEKYADPEETHLINMYSRYSNERNFNKYINEALVKLGEKLKIEEKLSTYVARHSYATILANKIKISIDDLSLCLNHVNKEKKVTLVYVEKDFTKVDNANRKFVKYILDTAKKEALKSDKLQTTEVALAN